MLRQLSGTTLTTFEYDALSLLNGECSDHSISPLFEDKRGN